MFKLLLMNPALMAKLFEMVIQTVQATESHLSGASGETKKKEALEALAATYDMADEFLRLPDDMDSYIKDELLPQLLETVVTFMNGFGLLKK